MVVHAVPLIWALGPGGGRDRVAEILPSLQQHLGNRGFSATRRSREHQEKRLHSRFSSCSRNFSNSPFIATTVLSDLRVACLGAHRVHLAPQLLRQEAEALSDGLSAGQRLTHRCHMSLEPHQLLGDVQLIGQERELLGQPLLIYRPAVEQLGHCAAEPVSLPHQPFGRAGGDLLCRLLQQIQPVAELGGQRGTLASPHGPAVLAGSGNHRLDLAPRHLDRAIAGVGQHVGLPRHQLDRHFTTQAQRRLHFPKPIGHQPGPFEIEAKPGICFQVLGPARLHRDVAPVEVAPQSIAHLHLERAEIAGELCREIEVAMVHGSDLDPKPSSGHRALRRAEARHAVRQASSLKPEQP